MSDLRTSETNIELYAGLGTLRQLRWAGPVACVPREGEQVDIGGSVYEIDRVRHVMGSGKKKTWVEIYVR